jgi:hypothetical protein
MAPQAITALIILVPEAEALVKEFRDKYDHSAAEGMPAHVTVLYPFKTLEHIGEDVGGGLTQSVLTSPTRDERADRNGRLYSYNPLAVKLV